MYCKKCGTENKDGMKYCKYCGNELQKSNDISADNSSYHTEKKKKSILSKILITLIIITVLFIIAIIALIIFNNLKVDSSNENIVSTTTEMTSASETDVPTTATEEPTTLKLITVPDLIGLKSDDAIKKLDNAGLKYNMLLEESDTVDIDYVISQSPVSGNDVKSDEIITVYVSKSKIDKKSDNSSFESSKSAGNSMNSANTLYCCASDFATLRDTDSRNGKSLAKIKTREEVEWIGSTGEFYYVKYKGKNGYVLKDFFSSDPNAALNYGSGNVE